MCGSKRQTLALDEMFFTIRHALLLQARRFPEGSESRLFYEVGLQALLICFVIVILIAGKQHRHH